MPRPSETTSETNLYGLDQAGLAAFFERYGGPSFHATQVYRWLYSRGRLDPSGWTDLPKALREKLRADTRVDPGHVGERIEASDGTLKYRVDFAGGGSVESVYMTQSKRVTLCLSSQVGCALDCAFCLTGKMGFGRHLTAGEIAGQVALIREDRDLDRPFNLVFMGMGEPLHNYDGVLAAFRLLTDPDGFALSPRRVTVSTAGLAPAIERLAAEPVRPRLAVSLNATTDDARRRLMPITRKYPLERLLAACRHFAESTGERFTFEYVLLEGINDSDADLARLARIVRPQRAKLNLIPFNPVPGRLPFRPPSERRVLAIRDRMLAANVRVSVRWSRGADARAACGQLALADKGA